MHYQPVMGSHGGITIGVVGADEFARRVMAVAREIGNPSWRLIPAVYDREIDAHDRAAAIAADVDVCLFAGPFPYDVATGPGDLSVPATYVPVGGAALYGVLLQGVLKGIVDPLRVSIDSVLPQEVQAAYREIGLSAERVHTRRYIEPGSVKRFLAFHRDLYQRGETTGAVTTVPTVAAALHKAGIPTLKMAPTEGTLRQALHTAALVGSGSLVGDSQIVIIVVRVPGRVFPQHTSASDYWYQDLRLSLHRVLLHGAREMDAALLPLDERSYLVVTTMSSLRAATDDLTEAPLVRRAAAELGLMPEVGIGLGTSTREAEFNARTAAEKAGEVDGTTAYLIGPGDLVLQLPSDGRTAPEGQSRSARDTKGVELLAKLAAKLDDVDRIVDAEQVATMLGVTARTARRTLRTLVADGLAWPMPPGRSSRVGRPTRPYQLLVEKLPPTGNR